MNRDNIKTYFEKALLVHVTLNKTEEDYTYAEMDTLWYKTLTEQERHLIGMLLDDQNASTPELLLKHRLHKIITTLQEKPVMLNVFETKEEYLKLRTVWKKFHAEGKHKPKLIEYTTSTPNNRWMFDGDKAYYKESALGVHHYLIYAAARGKDLSKAFSSMDKDNVKTLLRYYTFLSGNENTRTELFGNLAEIIDVDIKYHKPIVDRIVTYLSSHQAK